MSSISTGFSLEELFQFNLIDKTSIELEEFPEVP